MVGGVSACALRKGRSRLGESCPVVDIEGAIVYFASMGAIEKRASGENEVQLATALRRCRAIELSAPHGRN